jgi:hypothetical protein
MAYHYGSSPNSFSKTAPGRLPAPFHITTIEKDHRRADVRRYLYPGDGWRYWHMAKDLSGSPGPDNRIINRNRVEDAARLREAGIIR